MVSMLVLVPTLVSAAGVGNIKRKGWGVGLCVLGQLFWAANQLPRLPPQPALLHELLAFCLPAGLRVCLPACLSPF